MGSRNAIENQKGKNEIDSLEHTTKYVHQFLFEITLEHSSSNNTFFQISILRSRIEIIEFFSILRNYTIYVERIYNRDSNWKYWNDYMI